MKHHVLAVIISELWAISTVQCSIHGILVNDKACQGQAAHFIGTGGTITSPLYPGASPKHVFCTWILNNPHQDTLILSFSKFDLDVKKLCSNKLRYSDCCPHQFLVVQTEENQEEHNSSTKTNRGRKKLRRGKHRRETFHRIRKRQADDNISDSERRPTHHKDDQDKPNRFPFGSNWYNYFQRFGGYDGGAPDNLTTKSKKKTNLNSNKSKDVIPLPDNKNPQSVESRSHKGDYVLTHATNRKFDHGKSKSHSSGRATDRTLEPVESTGHMCGDTVPDPLITNAAKVFIKFFSDTNVDAGHLGFTLQYQISGEVTECGAEEFMCNDPRLCIPNSWKCNGQSECPDASDEISCQAGCSGVSDSQHCDGRWNCKLGQDELGCFGCDADEWWCGEGPQCYKATRRCDGIRDCHNGADEIYCGCFNRTQCEPNSEFCYDPKTQRCDGILHCPGGQDESHCVKKLSSQQDQQVKKYAGPAVKSWFLPKGRHRRDTTITGGGHCGENISCGHGDGCYTAAQRCDGASQCTDGSDEADCIPKICSPKHGAFLCANLRCIREAWRCDQFDDCGDASDEVDCLRNSVIVAAAMGGLICSLLLVVAVGCTCRLYALRMGISQLQPHNGRGGRRSTPLAPLSRLEQHLLEREPPPSYSVAVNDPSALLFGGGLSRHWRRHRGRPPPPPEGVLAPGPAPLRSHSCDAPQGHASRRSSFSVGNCGARGRRNSEEKEGEERAKVVTLLPAPTPTPQDAALSPNTEDVPLLMEVVSSGHDSNFEDRDDVPLLDSTSSCEETDQEDCAIIGGETEDSVTVSESAGSEWPSATDPQHTHLQVQKNTPVQDNVCDNTSTCLSEHTLLDSDDDEPLCMSEDPAPRPSHEREDDLSLSGDVMTDTRVAVLALSAVQRHTDGACQVDTELMSR